MQLEVALVVFLRTAAAAMDDSSKMVERLVITDSEGMFSSKAVVLERIDSDGMVGLTTLAEIVVFLIADQKHLQYQQRPLSSFPFPDQPFYAPVNRVQSIAPT